MNKKKERFRSLPRSHNEIFNISIHAIREDGDTLGISPLHDYYITVFQICQGVFIKNHE